MTYLTPDEVVFLVEHVHERINELSQGDWEVNKQDIADMHCLASKLINLQKE